MTQLVREESLVSCLWENYDQLQIVRPKQVRRSGRLTTQRQLLLSFSVSSKAPRNCSRSGHQCSRVNSLINELLIFCHCKGEELESGDWVSKALIEPRHVNDCQSSGLNASVTPCLLERPLCLDTQLWLSEQTDK